MHTHTHTHLYATENIKKYETFTLLHKEERVDKLIRSRRVRTLSWKRPACLLKQRHIVNLLEDTIISRVTVDSSVRRVRGTFRLRRTALAASRCLALALHKN